MTRPLLVLAILAMGGVLSGCGPSGEDELREWMREVRGNIRPKIVPLPEPKQFTPVDYAAGNSMDPFSPLKLTQALRKESAQSTSSSLVAPEMARRKEPLEAYPLDAMAMVGSLNKSGMPTALLSVDRLIYQVKVGNYLGQNYGKITKISETEIRLREIVQDATGEWIERTSTLSLQEGKVNK